MRLTTTALVALLLLSCAASAPPSGAERPDQEEGAAGAEELGPPPPFTAEQIRAASPKGRTYLWRFEVAGEASLQRLVFLRVDEGGAEMRSFADGEAGPTEYVTWDALEQHGRFPAESTRRTRTEIEVPAGRFDAWLYTIERKEERTQIWFADSLPGAPVAQRIHRAGRLIFSMELLEHELE